MIRLDKRLNAIMSEIEGDSLADIGCDHGRLAISAIQCGRVKRVVASDISEKSLQKARLLAKSCAVEEVTLRCGNGFEGFADNEVDVAVIAGMGGREIAKILENAPRGINKFVFVPHADEGVLRSYLENNDYAIVKDYTVKCNKKFYHIITAKIGKMQLTEKELLLGSDDTSNADYKEYLIYLKTKFVKLVRQISDDARKQQFENYINIIEAQLDKCN